MAKRKASKKAGVSKGTSGSRSKEGKKSYKQKSAKSRLEVEDVPGQYGHSTISFSVVRAGKRKNYAIKGGFGYFIRSLRKADNLVQVNQVVESGIQSKEVEPVIEYLGLTVPEVARAAAVSPSTVFRWKADSSIGTAGSNQFFRIDEVIRKGVELFGGLAELKAWLQRANTALGNAVPAQLITSPVGVEMVDEALDALHYGNVM